MAEACHLMRAAFGGAGRDRVTSTRKNTETIKTDKHPRIPSMPQYRPNTYPDSPLPETQCAHTFVQIRITFRPKTKP